MPETTRLFSFDHGGPRPRRSALGAVFLAAAVLMAACSSGDSVADSSTSSTTEALITEVADQSIPESFQGAWRVSESGEATPAECDQSTSAVENFGRILVIEGDGFSLFETGGLLLEVTARTDDYFEATFDTTSADEPTEDQLAFELIEDGAALTLSGGERIVSGPDGSRYARCP